MNEKHATAEKRRRVENLRHLRLTTLLRDLMRSEGRMEAAEMLGVSYRTLARAVESRRLSGRLSEALERLLLEGGDSVATRQQQRIEAVERRVEGLEGGIGELAEEMRGGFEELRPAVESGGKALPDEDAREAAQAKERPVRSEKRRASREAAEAPPSVAGLRPLKRATHRRLDPLVVTEEAEPDDEGVYGPAWPVIDQWRRLREGHPHQGKSLSWLVMDERILGLELALLEEHGLTLPPEKQPLRSFGRNGQINWRRTALYDTRRARAKRDLLRWVRRVFTLGLWRK